MKSDKFRLIVVGFLGLVMGAGTALMISWGTRYLKGINARVVNIESFLTQVAQQGQQRAQMPQPVPQAQVPPPPPRRAK